jgi:hypothetical protein
MKIEIEVPDAVVEKIVNKFKKPRPGEDFWDTARRAIYSPKQIIKADAETLLAFYADGRLGNV